MPILLASSSPRVTESIEAPLRKAGHDVVIARSLAGVALAIEHTSDLALVIIDVDLEPPGGIEEILDLLEDVPGRLRAPVIFTGSLAISPGGDGSERAAAPSLTVEQLLAIVGELARLKRPSPTLQ